MAAISPPMGFFISAGPPGIVVTLDGSLQDNTSGATRIYTVVGTIPAGSLVVLHAICGASTISSAVDSKSNTWVVDLGPAGFPGFLSSFTTTQLVAGDTITVTWATSGTGAAIICSWSTHGQASSVDKTKSANGTSNSLSTGATAATVQASELAFGLGDLATTAAITEDATYTTLASITFAGATKRLHAAYRILSATGAQTYAPTTTGSPPWAAQIATYKMV